MTTTAHDPRPGASCSRGRACPDVVPDLPPLEPAQVDAAYDSWVADGGLAREAQADHQRLDVEADSPEWHAADEEAWLAALDARISAGDYDEWLRVELAAPAADATPGADSGVTPTPASAPGRVGFEGLTVSTVTVQAFVDWLASVIPHPDTVGDAAVVPADRPAGPSAAPAAPAASELVDLLAMLSRLPGAIAAAQGRVSLELGRTTIRDAVAAGTSAVKAREAVAPQVGLARKCSPARAEQHLALARALDGMPNTHRALTAGLIEIAHAAAVASATNCLSEDHRAEVDALLADRLVGITAKRLGQIAAKYAAELDPQAVVAKHKKARSERAVWTRPAPDGMTYLTIFGPLTDVISALAALRRHAKTVANGGLDEEDPAEGRTESQIMADAALRWLAGRDRHQAQPVALNLVMHPDSLFGPNGHYTSTPCPSGSFAATRTQSGRANAPYAPASARSSTATHAEPTDAKPTVPERGDTEPGDTEPGDGEVNVPPAGSRPRTAPGETDPTTGAAFGSAHTDLDPSDRPGPIIWPGGGARTGRVNTPAWLVGHGPMPAPLARALLLHGCHPEGQDPDSQDPGSPHRGGSTGFDPASRPGHTVDPSGSATANRAAQVTFRRIFTSPDGRDLAALESTARLFPAGVRRALILRDDHCRTPYCDADIRHADHVHPAARGGLTALLNGQGLSVRCNYTKDLPGFTTRVLTQDEIAGYAAGDAADPNTHLARQAGPHTHVTAITTPTGHTYLSVAPPLLG